MKIGNHYLTKIPKTKITIPILVAASIFTITMVSFSPIDVSAEYGQFQISEISGTVTITDPSDDYSDKAQIALSVAMAVSENSVENGKAMWDKLDVVQGFLVYKIGILASDNIFHIQVVNTYHKGILSNKCSKTRLFSVYCSGINCKKIGHNKLHCNAWKNVTQDDLK